MVQAPYRTRPELRDFVDFKEEYEKMGVGK